MNLIMNLIIKLLPVILISIIFYILFYNLYPTYKQTLSLVQKFNSLKNKEKELKSLENLMNTLKQNSNIQKLVENKETIDSWLPDKPKVEEVVYSLDGIFSFNGLKIKNLNFSEKTVTTTPEILPLGILTFEVFSEGDENSFINIIDQIEKNVRLMEIKSFSISNKGDFQIKVDSFFVQTK